MTHHFTISLIAALALASATATAENIPNPIIEHTVDAGCYRWAGKFYFGGGFTYGDYLISDNLVDWPDRVHVIDIDNDWTRGTNFKSKGHPYNMLYRDGIFHLLFSVDYWGADEHIVHITHATSDSIVGRYTECRTDQWMENRLDPQVFVDDDGSMYLYMVKFTDGNTIWVRPLADDFSFSGDALQMFASQPGTWETMDNRVAEGPFVIKYRGRYYMMYNTNHTSARYGNYRLGVCEAPHPYLFNPAYKYSWPVVSPQTERLSETFVDLITYGNGEYNPVSLAADTINFRLAAIPDSPYMKVGQMYNTTVLLNGRQVNFGDDSDPTKPNWRGSQYRMYKIDPSWLNVGDNMIEIRRPDEKSDVVALALYDSPDDISGTLVLTPGQPNLLRGPNGWEWWLVYMANTGWSRHQFLDRVHFTDSRLAVDGITGPNSPGIHPVPAMPSMTDPAAIAKQLDRIPSYLLEAVVDEIPAAIPAGRAADFRAPHAIRIEKDGDKVTIWVDEILTADYATLTPEMRNAMRRMLAAPGVQWAQLTEGFDRYASRFDEWPGLTADADGLHLLPGEYLHAQKFDNYEVSANLRDLPLDDHSRAGVILAWRDKNNFVTATVDAAAGELLIERRMKGRSEIDRYPLAETFVCYPDLKNTDLREKQYRFDRMTRFTEIILPTLDAELDPYARDLSIDEGTRGYHPDMASLFKIQYLDDRTWRDLPMGTVDTSAPDRCVIPTDVTTRGIRFINRGPRDHNRHIYKIRATRAAKDGYQIRARRHGDLIDIFLDNRQIATLPAPQGPTQAGLTATTPAQPGLTTTPANGSTATTPALVSDMLLYRVN